MTTKSKSNQNPLTKLRFEKIEWLCLFVTILSCVTIICLKDMYVANVTYKSLELPACACDNCDHQKN